VQHDGSRWRSQNDHGNAARAEAPDLGADQGLRLVDSRELASHTATGVFADPGEPNDCQISLQGFKSFTWQETSQHRDKDSIYDGCDGQSRQTAKASELRESYMSDVPRIHGEAA
jgi:hypothetical protein